MWYVLIYFFVAELIVTDWLVRPRNGRVGTREPAFALGYHELTYFAVPTNFD